MIISRIDGQNLRCFQSFSLRLSPGINLFVGPNNSGKTTLLSAISTIQRAASPQPLIQRSGAKTSSLAIEFCEKFREITGIAQFRCEGREQAWSTTMQTVSGQRPDQSLFPNVEPDNVIFPHFASRDREAMNAQIGIEHGRLVTGGFSGIPPKFDRIMTQDEEFGGRELKSFCREVLGFAPSSVLVQNGKLPALAVDRRESIDIGRMGAGVAQMLGLLVDLLVTEGKLFLIEEPEADLHPRALRRLLGVIASRSSCNQMCISTHSNIVARELGAVPGAKIFRIRSSIENRVPTSTVQELGDDHNDRAELLRDLGYELSDLHLWDYWLILEESSAEAIVREFLIPWFVPRLSGRLRTIASDGVGDVERRLDALNHLFVFLHLSPAYKNRAWVIVDAGQQEEEALRVLRERYMTGGWRPGQFLQFGEHDFESYYPDEFSAQVRSIMTTADKQARRSAKAKLSRDIVAWARRHPQQAKESFAKSAIGAIKVLKEIEAQVIEA